MLLALILGPSLTGCIAIKPTVALVQTNEALQAAELAGAEEKAPYEWTMATEHQRKAREEWGGSEFEECEILTKAAYQYALQAEDLAKYGESDVDVERRDMLDEVDKDLDGVEDQ